MAVYDSADILTSSLSNAFVSERAEKDVVRLVAAGSYTGSQVFSSVATVFKSGFAAAAALSDTNGSLTLSLQHTPDAPETVADASATWFTLGSFLLDGTTTQAWMNITGSVFPRIRASASFAGGAGDSGSLWATIDGPISR